MSPTRKITPYTLSSYKPCPGGDPTRPEPPHPAAAEGKHLSAHIRGSGKGGVLAQQLLLHTARSPGVQLHPQS